MRQAGRYMAEYRALKEQHSFLELCKTPELALRVSLLPLELLEVDAIILFSDILIPVEAMGLRIDFAPGPIVKNPIATPRDVEALEIDAIEDRVGFVFETLRELRNVLKTRERGDQALIGFAGSPWTLACYTTSQQMFKHFEGTLIFAKREPAAMELFLGKLTQVVSDYVCAQIESGAQVIQLFDTWAGNLSAEDYRRWALPFTKQIIARISERGCPSILYVNNCSHLLGSMIETGATCLSVDQRVSLASVSAAFPDTVVQGNLDPAQLFSPTETVSRSTREMIKRWPKRSGYIVNLGHGVLPTTPIENVRAFIRTARDGWADETGC